MHTPDDASDEGIGFVSNRRKMMAEATSGFGLFSLQERLGRHILPSIATCLLCRAELDIDLTI